MTSLSDLDDLPGAGRAQGGFLPPGLLPALVIIAAVFAWSCVGSDAAMPRAQGGLLDLSGWDMERGGPVRLDGQWEMYPQRLLTPEDLHAPAPPEGAVFQTLPERWSLDGLKSGEGMATLRLLVTLPPGAPPSCLRVYNVNSAYRLWANGRLVGQSGTLGTSEATEQARPASQLLTLPHGIDAESRLLELVLQISNFHYRDGGVTASLWLGSAEVLHAREKHFIASAIFFAGALLIMGVYHVALYFFRRHNVSPLYFAMYCFLWMGNYGASDSSEWVARVFWPSLSTRLLDHFALACFFVSVPVGYAFFRSLYPREFFRPVLRFAWGLALVSSALAAALSTMHLTSLLPLFYLITAGLILHCLKQLHQAWRLGREGAAFIFAGFLFLGCAGLNDMLTDIKVLNSTPLLGPGMLAFILCQAFALSQRLSRAFSAVESLSSQLEAKNLSLETEITERNRLERQIIFISEEERRRMSLDLHDGLCQLLTAARLRCAILTRMKPQADESRELGHLSTILDELVNQAYDLSHGLWPLEHDASAAGPSLNDMIQRFSRSSGVPIEFTQERACEGCANPDVTQLYRIAQEALANAVKHAQPSRIAVSFRCRMGGRATLSVCDDGVGRARAKPTQGGLGMGIMAHRARMIGGELTIEDGPEGGTVVTCTISCDLTHGQQRNSP